jgi:predicted GTPase
MTKSDTHEKEDLQNILLSAKSAFSSINFEEYFITSARTGDGIEAVFLAAAETYARRGMETQLSPPKPDTSNSSCC